MKKKREGQYEPVLLTARINEAKPNGPGNMESLPPILRKGNPFKSERRLVVLH